MKIRITALLLAALCAALPLSACSPAPEPSDSTPIDSYDTERQFPVETTEDESSTVATGFTVKEKAGFGCVAFVTDSPINI